MSMSERMEKRNCDNPIYLRNLVKSLEEAKERKDTKIIIQYATELERYKVLCGYSPAIQQLEESMKRVSDELHLTENSTIKRALSTIPQKRCSCERCESEQSPHQEPQRKEGFLGQLEASRGVQNAPTSEDAEPEQQPTSEFRRMLEESGKGSTKREQPHTAILNTTRTTGICRFVDETQFPEFCDPEKCPKDFARHCRANTESHFGQPCIYLTPKNR